MRDALSARYNTDGAKCVLRDPKQGVVGSHYWQDSSKEKKNLLSLLGFHFWSLSTAHRSCHLLKNRLLKGLRLIKKCQIGPYRTHEHLSGGHLFEASCCCFPSSFFHWYSPFHPLYAVTSSLTPACFSSLTSLLALCKFLSRYFNQLPNAIKVSHTN